MSNTEIPNIPPFINVKGSVVGTQHIVAIIPETYEDHDGCYNLITNTKDSNGRTLSFQVCRWGDSLKTYDMISDTFFNSAK